MISEITGVEFNNKDICIKGNTHFACVCKKCIKEFLKKLYKKYESFK